VERQAVEKPVLILLAEDEPLIGLSIRESLEEGGYSVHVAASGREAIAALEGGEDDFAGLITDIRLGGGPDGWALARRARELKPEIPVVYISGDSAHEHRARGVPDSLMVQKPFAMAQVVTAISTLLTKVPPKAPE
jgi:CheY-like chemotaxis protein